MKTLALAALLCGLALPAAAQNKLLLPVGDWVRQSKGKADCSRWIMTIEAERIILRDDSTEGVCKVTSLKKKGGNIIGETACKWPEGGYPAEDMDGFSLSLKSPTVIVFNNATYSLCPTMDKAQ